MKPISANFSAATSQVIIRSSDWVCGMLGGEDELTDDEDGDEVVGETLIKRKKEISESGYFIVGGNGCVSGEGTRLRC